MMDAVEFLSVDQITKSFAGNVVLRDINFDVKVGEVHALVGENGAGKSTLMNILCGSLQPNNGTIRIDGQLAQFGDPGDALKAGVAMMHQEPKVAEALSVAENVFMGRLPKTGGIFLDRETLNREVDAILQDIGVSFCASTTVGSLNVAQRQLVQLARAMSQGARLIIMDEPTASLTPIEVGVLFSLMRRLKERGIAIIYISHHLDEIFQIANRVTVFRDGAKVAMKYVGETTKNELINLMVGRDLGSHFPPRRLAKPGDILLEARGLSGPGFKDVSLQIRSGEIVGLAGLVGAGRTELARVLCGAVKRTAGEIRLGGATVNFAGPATAVEAGIAYLSEDRRDSILRPLSVKQNITLAARRSFSRFGIVRADAERMAAENFVRHLNIRTTSVDQLAGQLSGGNQQKCVIARWILNQSRVIIFDEPTRGIDVGAKREIYGLIHELATNGCAILMISSELPEVISISDRILIMSEGRLSGEISADTATENAVIQLAVPQNRSLDKHVQ